MIVIVIVIVDTVLCQTIILFGEPKNSNIYIYSGPKPIQRVTIYIYISYQRVSIHPIQRVPVPYEMVDPETGKFRPYTDVKAGLLNTKLAGVASVDGDGTDLATSPRACLTDSISELEVVPSPDQRAPSEWSDDSGEESESDEDESCAWLYQ